MRAVRIRVTGTVQGVGFRPFCYREAARAGLAGFVLNDLGGVEIYLEGTEEAIARFLHALRTSPPPASRITGIEVSDAPSKGLEGFEIVSSKPAQASQSLEVSADLATCPACRREIAASANRRHGYAFTNCTDCGPRYTIIRDLPYDRPKTTMHEFRMCPQCQAEYDDPEDRRFHAQPNACPVCGPELVLLEPNGRVRRCKNPLEETVRLLAAGGIVAVKGLGGYHLMCEAANPEAVQRLRKRKRRPHKALAVMCRDIRQARSLGVVSAAQARALASPAAPIVLVPWRPGLNERIRSALAPMHPRVGIMLAYTPLHHLLFAHEISGRLLGPLVATSANHADEPLIADERELIERLGDVPDAVLAHNRPIYNRIDDSIAFVEPSDTARGEAGANLGLLRRARGFAPAPLISAFEFPAALAVGAQMKGSFALSQGRRVWLSPHIGELTNRATLEFFEETLRRYMDWFRVRPQAVVCDAHPDYLSSRWAERYCAEQGVALLRVQHHHAHAAAVMLEHELDSPVLGLSLDGTGYGEDGTIWGCELLRITQRAARFERLGHLRELPLVGGELAIRRPRRMAAGVTAEMFGEDRARRMFGAEGELAAAELKRGVRVVRASSAGRLFDTLAGLMGLVEEITFEAQAPLAVEWLCSLRADPAEGYPFGVADGTLDPEPCLAAVLEDLDAGTDMETMAWRFHRGFAAALLDWLELAREKTGLGTVVCSGGVFANQTLVRLLVQGAGTRGLTLLFPKAVPPTDGGLAAGQIMVARSLIQLEPIERQTT